jgi:hypothetical protein
MEQLEYENHDTSISLDFLIKVGLYLSFISFLMLAMSKGVADPDLWGYLSFGRLFWHSNNQFPYHDVFAYVPTLNPCVYHEWLTGVLFYPLYQTLGAPGLLILKYSLILWTMALVYLTARSRGAHLLVVGLFITVTFIAARPAYFSSVRAQVFTWFFFALYLNLLEHTRLTENWRGLYWLPVIQVAWCNLHGGFLAGLGLIALYTVGEFISRRPYLPYLLFLILSVLFTLINPYCIDYWKYIAHAVTMPRPFVMEWSNVFQSYQSGLSNVWLFIYLLTLISVILFGTWQSQRWEVTPSLALVTTLVLGLGHVRHLIFFLILVGAYLPVCFQRNVEYVKSLPWVKGLWNLEGVKTAALGILSLVILINIGFLTRGTPLCLNIPGKMSFKELPIDCLPYPVDAVKFIKKQGLSRNILTHFGWGEYLIWELYPQCLVAFDGRYETVYPTEVEKKFTEFIYAIPQRQRFLEDYPPDLILLNKRWKIAQLLEKDPKWFQIYSDSTSVLFVPCTKKSLVSLRGSSSQ